MNESSFSFSTNLEEKKKENKVNFSQNKQILFCSKQELLALRKFFFISFVIFLRIRILSQKGFDRSLFFC